MLGGILGLLAGLFLHELAHAMACMAYGGYVFEIGVMLKLVFPGAYVMMDTRPITGRLKRAQVSAAGIEANLLLAGLALFCAVHFPGSSLSLFYTALFNTELALVNLLLVDGLDGAGIMAELLGLDSLSDAVKDGLYGLVGKGRRPDPVYTVVCASMALVQPAQIVLILLNVWVVVSWIM